MFYECTNNRKKRTPKKPYVKLVYITIPTCKTLLLKFYMYNTHKLYKEKSKYP